MKMSWKLPLFLAFTCLAQFIQEGSSAAGGRHPYTHRMSKRQAVVATNAAVPLNNAAVPLNNAAVPLNNAVVPLNNAAADATNDVNVNLVLNDNNSNLAGNAVSNNAFASTLVAAPTIVAAPTVVATPAVVVAPSPAIVTAPAVVATPAVVAAPAPAVAVANTIILPGYDLKALSDRAVLQLILTAFPLTALPIINILIYAPGSLTPQNISLASLPTTNLNSFLSGNKDVFCVTGAILTQNTAAVQQLVTATLSSTLILVSITADAFEIVAKSIPALAASLVPALTQLPSSVIMVGMEAGAHVLGAALQQSNLPANVVFNNIIIVEPILPLLETDIYLRGALKRSKNVAVISSTVGLMKVSLPTILPIKLPGAILVYINPFDLLPLCGQNPLGYFFCAQAYSVAILVNLYLGTASFALVDVGIAITFLDLPPIVKAGSIRLQQSYNQLDKNSAYYYLGSTVVGIVKAKGVSTVIGGLAPLDQTLLGNLNGANSPMPEQFFVLDTYIMWFPAPYAVAFIINPSPWSVMLVLGNQVLVVTTPSAQSIVTSAQTSLLSLNINVPSVILQPAVTYYVIYFQNNQYLNGQLVGTVGVAVPSTGTVTVIGGTSVTGGSGINTVIIKPSTTISVTGGSSGLLGSLLSSSGLLAPVIGSSGLLASLTNPSGILGTLLSPSGILSPVGGLLSSVGPLLSSVNGLLGGSPLGTPPITPLASPPASPLASPPASPQGGLSSIPGVSLVGNLLGSIG